MDALLNVLMVLATCIALWSLIVVGRPALARARLVDDLSTLRDEVEDAVLDGKIDSSEPAADFIAKADMILDNPRIASFSCGLALHLALGKQGVDLSQLASGARDGYKDLSEADAKFLSERDTRVVRALSRYTVHGSIMWFVLLALRRLVRVVNGVEGNHAGRTSAPTPSNIARGSWGLGPHARDRVA